MRIQVLRIRLAVMGAALAAIALIGSLLLPSQRAKGADDPELKALEKAYQPEIHGLVQKYCADCHSEKRAEADVDLTTFTTLAEVRKHPQVWQKVGEMLDSGQMPPKKARQPSELERTRLQQWVRGYLTVEARAHAGDPGRVVLRRLSNAEYTYTLRDLTGVGSLDPAREFPGDGAAGEGFTNTGNALVMSPALVTKYLDAGKQIANHAVLTSNGIHFSPKTTPRDWSEESLARIREFYGRFTSSGGGDKVNLQGIVFDTNDGGRLPVDKYLLATLEEREALTQGRKSIEAVAQERQLNAKYLGTLWKNLVGTEPSLLLDHLRSQWRVAKPQDVPGLVAGIAAWQKELWKFTTVGHIGKVGGPKAWQETVTPLVSAQAIRHKITAPPDAKEVTLSLVASDTGDGNEQDVIICLQPRFVAPGRPDLLLRDVRDVTRNLTARRERVFAKTTKYLGAADEAREAEGKADIAELARKYEIETDSLRAWLDYLGIGSGGSVELRGVFTNKLNNGGGYAFVNGWGNNELPSLLANSSDQAVRIPGQMKPHSVCVHPTPTLFVAAGWRSPVTAAMHAEATVTHAHPECGNGVTWSLELRRGVTRQRLASGISHGGQDVKVGPIENLSIQAGDLVSLLIGPRDGNHACDLTSIDLKLTTEGAGGRTWSLASDVSSDVLAGNPHADKFGNAGVWNFYSEPVTGGSEVGPVIPPGSLLAQWQNAKSPEVKQKLAEGLQTLLTSGTPKVKEGPDALLYRQITSLGGPLLGSAPGKPFDLVQGTTKPGAEGTKSASNASETWSVDPAAFGKLPNGTPTDGASLSFRAPSVIEMRLPAELVAGSELVTTAVLGAAEGSVQIQVVEGKPASAPPLQPGLALLASDGSATRKRVESGFNDFRELFPSVLCYTKIVPVDEVVTLTLFYREDDHLQRLMLDDAQKAYLNGLWDELHYVSQDALTSVDVFLQLLEYASQDGDPKLFEPLRKPINERAAAFRKHLLETEPKHLDAVLEFAGRAYRRPLTKPESQELRSLYASMRKQEIPHDEAIRLTLARVLVAPAFLYRVEKPGPGSGQGPVSDWELASRLSYFLWASQPDEELRRLAAEGRLHDPEVMRQQTRRMLHDPKTRRLATEFACQWLHISEFDQLDEKSERHFPTFLGLRGAMYEESIQFFTDFFQNDGSVLGILDADHTFLNESLAKHYGIPFKKVSQPASSADKESAASDWRRVDGVRPYGRGGILGQATTLSKQSGASRTSPILRGNWISEVLLGERLPRPPKGVPVLPEDEAATAGLTVRQLVEKHSSDAKCIVCHQRIDPFGFSLEAYDAIGRKREKDLGDRVIDTRVKAMDGARFEGLDGLRSYLLTARRDAFVRQFCRKLLGYSLGRAVQLSDEPLLAEMQTELKAKDYHVVAAIEAIVRSRQFREIRGREMAYDD